MKSNPCLSITVAHYSRCITRIEFPFVFNFSICTRDGIPNIWDENVLNFRQLFCFVTQEEVRSAMCHTLRSVIFCPFL